MPGTVVVGAQWGDEGKGKVVDVLTPSFDAVVRYYGGKNAGHTVYSGNDELVQHLVPSSVLHEGKKHVLGDGMVLDPEKLNEEIACLRRRGLVDSSLLISNRAHLTLPHYYDIEKELEKRLRIGTTKMGIGTTYEFMMRRSGIRVCDLYEADLRDRLEMNIETSKSMLPEGCCPDVDETIRYLMTHFEGFKRHVTDTSFEINRWLQNGTNVLFEGAQGTHLDVIHGTYPHVTSSHPTSGGVATGAGIAPQDTYGITKYENLHGNARRYVEFLEEQTQIPITMISTGPKRHETIFR